jgi:putative salt-induced outer membrane protein YdiY
VALVVWAMGGGALLAQEAGLEAPPRPKVWGGLASAGLSLTRGNSDTLKLNVAFELTRDRKPRHLSKLNGRYLRGQEDGALSVDRTSMALRHEYTLRNGAFTFGQVEYLRDTFKQISYLIAPTAGFGYTLIDTEPTRFSVDAGVGAVWEKNPYEPVNPEVAVTAGQTLRHQLTKTTTLKHATTALLASGNPKDGLYTFSIGIGTRINDHLELALDVVDSYKTRPPTEATVKNDVAMVTGVTTRF